MVTAGIHPRFGHAWRYSYNGGFSSLSVGRVKGTLPALQLRTIHDMQTRIESEESIRTLISQIREATSPVTPHPEIIQDAKARGALHILKRMEIREREIPNRRNPPKFLKSTAIKVEVYDALKAARRLARIFRLGRT